MSIKMIIFDQDGTLYSKNSDLIKYTRAKTKEWLSYKTKKTLSEIEDLYIVLQEKYPNPYFGFESLGCTVQEYMEDVFDRIHPGVFLEFNPVLYEFFKNNELKKALVTFSSPKYTEELQEVLKIKDFFDSILYVKDFKTYNKKECYEKLANLFNIDFTEICVIGDSYYNDILPAQQLGCKTVFISNKKIKAVDTISSIEQFIKQGTKKIYKKS